MMFSKLKENIIPTSGWADWNNENDEQVLPLSQPENSMELTFEYSNSENVPVDTVDTIFSKSLCAQRDFFLSQAPSEWFKLAKKNKKITIQMPEGKGFEKNVIYIFQDKVTGKSLIGKTEQVFRRRMSQYCSQFNRPQGKCSNFIKDVQLSPQRFRVGILYQLKSGENIDQVEAAFIHHYREAGRPLYNQVGGGGGGRAKSAELPSFYAIPKTEGFPSPPKKYKVERINDKVRLLTSPGFRTKINQGRIKAQRDGRVFGHIYYYKRNLKDEKVKRYIGMSGVAESRVPQHCYNSQRKEGEFYQELATFPDEFEANVLDIEYINPNSLSPGSRERYDFFDNLGDAEEAVIQIARENGEVYNDDARGGRGTRARSMCAKSLFQED